MLEAAPFEERGGNSHFTGGAFRFAFRGVDDLIDVLPALAQENLANVDFGTYSEDAFFDDLFALTQYRTDPELAEILVRGSRDTAKWMVRQGVKLQPGLGRQAYEVDGKRYDEIPMTQTEFHHAKPVYEYLDGWWEDISEAKSFEDLPKAAKIYLNFLERYLKVKVTMVSVGKDREKTIHRK